MAFIQIIDLTTTKFEEVQRLEREWEAATEGRRTLRRETVCRDHANPNHYVIIAEFASPEDAQRNSELPETAATAEKMAALCDGPVQFTDLEVIETRP
jgi:quinol monooxygenase YgiN